MGGTVSKHWKINRLKAKYTLRELMKLSQEARNIPDEDFLLEAQRELSETLLPHLQNPSMILLLLQEKYHKPYLRSVVCKFLDAYLGSSQASTTENPRLAVRKAYHYHTPLNTT